VKDVIDCLRRGNDRDLQGMFRPEESVVVSVFDKGEAAADEVYGATTFREIAQRISEQEGATPGPAV